MSALEEAAAATRMTRSLSRELLGPPLLEAAQVTDAAALDAYRLDYASYRLGAMRGDFVLLGGLTAGGLAFFSTFDSTLRRSALECAVDGDGDSCEMVGELSDDEVRTASAPHRLLEQPPHRLHTASAPPSTACAPPAHRLRRRLSSRGR